MLLSDAAKDGDVMGVAKLLKEGAPVDWQDKYGWTALHMACNYNRPSVVKVLLIRNPSINLQDGRGLTPMHLASWRGHIDCIKLLMAFEPPSGFLSFFEKPCDLG